MNRYRKADERGRQHFIDDFGDRYIIQPTEGDYDRIDLYATARTDINKTYSIEVKSYDNPNHPRPYEKYGNYMIDYDKVDNLYTTSMSEGRIPIIYARFEDMTIVWDITDIPYKERKEKKKVNKDGQHYGKFYEYADVTYLYKEEAKYIKTHDKHQDREDIQRTDS